MDSIQENLTTLSSSLKKLNGLFPELQRSAAYWRGRSLNQTYCRVCSAISKYPIEDTTTVMPCCHQFCKQCTRKHLHFQIHKKSPKLQCPYSGCCTNLDDRTIHQIVDKNQWDRYQRTRDRHEMMMTRQRAEEAKSKMNKNNDPSSKRKLFRKCPYCGQRQFAQLGCDVITCKNRNCYKMFSITTSAREPTISKPKESKNSDPFFDKKTMRMIVRFTNAILVAAWGMLIGFGMMMAYSVGMSLEWFWTLRVYHSYLQLTMLFGPCLMEDFYKCHPIDHKPVYASIAVLGNVWMAVWLFVHVYGDYEMIKWSNYGLFSWILGGGEFERWVNLIFHGFLAHAQFMCLLENISNQWMEEVSDVLICSLVIGAFVEMFTQS